MQAIGRSTVRDITCDLSHRPTVRYDVVLINDFRYRNQIVRSVEQEIDLQKNIEKLDFFQFK